MALGFGNKTSVVNADNSHSLDGVNNGEKSQYDVEGQKSSWGGMGNQNGGRIAPVMYGAAGESDDEAAAGVAKQMELESDNAIKYRTCTWQKVSLRRIPF